MAASGASPGDTFYSEDFQVTDRWFNTSSGLVGSRGNATTLTWSIAPDGTSISPARSGESTDPSDFIAFMDDIYNVVGGGADLTTRSWFGILEDSYNRWGEISGLTINYEANDDGFEIRSTIDGVIGVRGDLRISGHRIDGNNSVLAYNYFPDAGNMVIDTDDSYYNNTDSDSIRLRNTLMHEIGHGLGFSHFESDNSNGLMEPFANESFYGPQHDDILAAQRNYGDALEKNGGNDTIANATSLGTFNAPFETISIGTDADDNSVVVTASETDFISIDGTSDTDVFAFTLGGLTSYDLSIVLDPKGPTYEEGAQGGSQSDLNTKALNDLQLELLDSSGTILQTADVNGAGVGESIFTTLLSGDYFARISVGSADVDNVQMYRLDISATLVPEPRSIALLALGGLLLIRRRRPEQKP